MLRLITFISVLLLSITSLTFANNSTDPNKEDVKLVLIGIVVDATETVLGDITVELSDLDTEETQTYVTKADGQFQFNLKPEKKYNVCVISENGDVLIKKEISTVNKTEPEVLHIMFSKE